jgi:hypothetical protein
MIKQEDAKNGGGLLDYLGIEDKEHAQLN